MSLVNQTIYGRKFARKILVGRPWISRASGWQTERADCNYLKK